MNRIVFLTSLLLFLPLGVFAADHPVTETELSAYKELTQTRIDALKESLQKDIQAQTAHIEAQNKQLEQQNKLLDSFSARIGDISIFLTGFGLLAGLVGYFTVRSRAQKEARMAAEEWMEKEGQKAIDEKLKGFDIHIATQKDAADAKMEAFGVDIEKLRVNAVAEIAEQQAQITVSQKSMDNKVHKQISSPNSDPISQLVEALKFKPEAEYGFDDWNARAHDAYKKGNFALAAEYWLQAARGGKANALQLAMSLCNASLSLANLDRKEESIAVLNEVILRYGSAPEAELRVQVASALITKSFTLRQLKRYEEALAGCDEMVSRFDSAPELELRTIVAQSEANRGAFLCFLNRYDEAITVYDQILSRYSCVHEAVLREVAAMACNGKGYVLLCRAKENWIDEVARLVDLQAATTLFTQAEKEISNKPVVWGNQAYIAYLLGQPEAARSLLQQALKQNGEWLHRATLDDLDVHPIPPDIEFRALLEEVWTEMKPKHDNAVAKT